MTRYAWLLLILGIAGFLRLYRFNTVPPGLYHDEAMNGNNALEALETGRFAPFYPENNGREGLYVNVAAVSIRLFGNQAWALRLPAAIFGIFTVWGLYLLAAEWFSPPVGLLASFFLATSFWHIDFSRMALRAIAAPCFLVWALYVLMVAIGRQGRGRPYVAAAILAGCVYGLGFYTYIAYRATPVLLAVLVFYFARQSRALVGWFALTAMVTAAPLAAYFARNPGTFLGRASQVSVFGGAHPARELVLNAWRTGRMFFTRGDINWRHNVSWRAELFWPVAMLFALGVVLAIWNRDRSLAALVWLGVAALPVVFSNERLPHALRSILMIPPVCILAAAGGHAAYGYLSKWAPRSKRLPGKWLPGKWLAALAGGLLLFLCYEPYHTYFDVWARDPHVPEYFEAWSAAIAERIQALPRETPKYVAVPAENLMIAQPVMFLTRSYTEREREETNIRYYVAAPTGDGCRQVTASMPQARVFCLPEDALK